jgi:hypothetical protein
MYLTKKKAKQPIRCQLMEKGEERKRLVFSLTICTYVDKVILTNKEMHPKRISQITSG